MKRKPKFLRVSRRTSYADRYRNMKRKTNIREFSTRRTPYAKRYMKAEPMFFEGIISRGSQQNDTLLQDIEYGKLRLC